MIAQHAAAVCCALETAGTVALGCPAPNKAAVGRISNSHAAHRFPKLCGRSSPSKGRGGGRPRAAPPAPLPAAAPCAPPTCTSSSSVALARSSMSITSFVFTGSAGRSSLLFRAMFRWMDWRHLPVAFLPSHQHVKGAKQPASEKDVNLTQLRPSYLRFTSRRAFCLRRTSHCGRNPLKHCCKSYFPITADDLRGIRLGRSVRDAALRSPRSG